MTAVTSPFRHITLSSPLNDKGPLQFLEPGTVVRVLGVSGWSLHRARVVTDNAGELRNPARSVSLEKIYFDDKGQEMPEGNPDTIRVCRDRVAPVDTTNGAA